MNTNFAMASILCSKSSFSATNCAGAIREICNREHHGYEGFYAADLPGLADAGRASALMRQLHAAGLIEKTGNTRPMLLNLERYAYGPTGWKMEVYKVITVNVAEWRPLFDVAKALALLDALDLDFDNM